MKAQEIRSNAKRIKDLEKMAYNEEGFFHAPEYKNDPARLRLMEEIAMDPYKGETPNILLTEPLAGVFS